MLDKKELNKLSRKFKKNSPLFIALGDEARQKLIVDIAEAGVGGINVSGLAARSRLSRPAISHHLKILREAGLITSAKKATQVFYRLSLKKDLESLADLINSLLAVVDRWDAEAVAT